MIVCMYFTYQIWKNELTRENIVERLRESIDGSAYCGNQDIRIRTEITIEVKLGLEHFKNLNLEEKFFHCHQVRIKHQIRANF